ncbi:mechanosensitive ion channel family protein [Halovivax gelatinilyticus]|uniref:mechanosensitive ion channel family protein n=1 Tax=Halovivax gelatinilyticus TaxID=2961597 RepID=UPI0020CA6B3F|nr:mechanosensitive ion channel family protein [Halovivax gelatinilyticus]
MFVPLEVDEALDPETYVPLAVDAAITIATFLVAFVVVYSLGKLMGVRLVRSGLERRGYEPAIVNTAVRVTVIVAAAVALALGATIAGFGVVLSAFAIFGGALALAVGFATQNLIANFVAGIFILQDKPFSIGDWIMWDDGEGRVRDIKLRVTKVETFDNELVTVPNADLADSPVTNPVANDRVRVRYDFGIGYDDDIDHAREVILDEARSLDATLEAPAPSAPVVDLGDSAVVLSGRLWIDPTEHGYKPTQFAFVEAVKKRFDAEGIDMPYHNTELSGAISVEQTA